MQGNRPGPADREPARPSPLPWPQETDVETDPMLFRATIRPNRSLDRRAFRLVITLCCMAAVVSSVPFMLLGAWPVAGFFGLDLVALYIAFRVNYRDGLSCEQVAVTPFKVKVAKIDPRGARAEWQFDTLWTRLERDEHDEFGLMRLAVVSRGQSVQVAQSLSPHERAEFATAFARALSDARQG